MLAVAGIVAVLILAAMELGWRHLGFAPMPRDTVQLWAKLREEATRRGRDVAVVIGSSRAQLGLDPAVLSAELGVPTVQLAMTGGSPLAPLRDLAEDDDFRGSVICEVTPTAFFAPLASIETLGGADWVRMWRKLPLVASFETSLRVVVQQKLALLTPETNPRYQLSALLTTKAFAPPPRAPMRADRFRPAHYNEKEATSMIAHWAEGLRDSKAPSADELRELSGAVAGWAARIQARGGSVVFVRIPSSFAVYETEERIWPRTQYWDVFVRSFASKSIYFADEPSLAHFTAVEGSHLDADTAAAFSKELGRILRARGWIRAAEQR